MQHIVKAILVVIVLSGVLWASWKRYSDFLSVGQDASPATKKLNEMEKKGVPNLSVADIYGKQISLESLRDKVVVVNFWASWCEPCVQEFPSLLKLVKEFKGEVVLLAISADYTMDDLQTFVRAFSVDDPNFKIIWDKNKSIAEEFGTEVLPESYVIGYDNKLVRKITGVDDWATEEAFEFFKVLVAQKKSGEKSGE